jgi:hypothetical protein
VTFLILPMARGVDEGTMLLTVAPRTRARPTAQVLVKGSRAIVITTARKKRKEALTCRLDNTRSSCHFSEGFVDHTGLVEQALFNAENSRLVSTWIGRFGTAVQSLLKPDDILHSYQECYFSAGLSNAVALLQNIEYRCRAVSLCKYQQDLLFRKERWTKKVIANSKP